MVSLTSCQFPVKKLDPVLIDIDEDTCERVKIVETKPEITFEFVGDALPFNAECFRELASKHETGLFVVLPFPQAMEMKRAWEAANKKE